MHVAIGRKYRDRRTQQGRVVYLALEGGRGFANRIKAWRRRCLAEHDQAVPFFLIDTPLALVDDHRDLITAIREQLKDEPPAVITIDTLNRSLTGSENKDEDMGAYIRAADALREAFDSAAPPGIARADIPASQAPTTPRSRSSGTGKASLLPRSST
jgi:hypothetical protein